MIRTALTNILRLGDAYQRPIAILGSVWLFISCASYIDFLMIPAIPYLTDDRSWMFAAAWNTVWWSAAYPVLDNHRKKLRAQNEPDDQAPGSGPGQADKREGPA